MMTNATKPFGPDRLATITTTMILVLILFAPALWRFFGMVILQRGLDFAFYSYQMPLLQGALVAVLIWRMDFREIFFSPRSRMLHPLLAVLALGFSSAIFSDVALFAFLHQARWFIWGCFVVALAAFAAGGEGRAKLIIDLVFGGFIFYAAFFHLLVFTLDPAEVKWLHQMPGYGNIRFFGHYALAALMLSYYPILKAEAEAEAEADLKLLPLLLRALPVALCWSMVFWSGSRASALAAVMTLGILAASGHIRRPGYVAVVTLAAVVIAVLWSFVIGTGGEGFGLFRLIGAMQRFADMETAGAGRFIMWLATLAAIPDAPFLGHGAGTLSFVLPPAIAMFYHPHNLVLQALFDWGAIIGTAFLATLAWLVWRVLRAPKRNGKRGVSAEISTGFALLTAMALAAMVDGTFYHPDPMMLAGVGLALALPAMQPLIRSGIRPVTPLDLSRSAGFVVGAGLAASFALCLTAASTAAAIGSRQAPEYDSLRARFVQTLPYSFFDTFGLYSYGRWIDQWASQVVDQGRGQLSAQVIDAELARIDRYSRWATPQKLVAVRRACARGDLAEALTILDELDQDIAAFVRGESAYLRQALDDYWVRCPVED